MPEADSTEDAVAGYLAEYRYLGTYVHQTLRERHGFLALSLAGSGFILGLLMRSTPTKSPGEACFLVALAASVTLVAERMTIRATQGIANILAYFRLFLEPQVPGLGFYVRYASFRGKTPLSGVRRRVSGARDLVYAYLTLTAAFLLAWLAAPVQGHRQWWQTALVGALGAISLVQTVHLRRLSAHGWRAAEDAWSVIWDRERNAAGGNDSSL